jgi:hypothetical protein
MPSTIEDELTIMASAPASATTVSAVRCGNLDDVVRREEAQEVEQRARRSGLATG